jgi:hypothetical protein
VTLQERRLVDIVPELPPPPGYKRVNVDTGEGDPWIDARQGVRDSLSLRELKDLMA